MILEATSAYLRDYLDAPTIIPTDFERQKIDHYLTKDGPHDILVLAAKKNRISPLEIFDRGRLILESGIYSDREGDQLPLNTKAAGNILSSLFPRSILFRESPLSLALSAIENSPFPIPYEERQKLRKNIMRLKINEMSARVIHLLLRGEIGLYPYDESRKRPHKSGQKDTGIGFVEALAKVPGFNEDYVEWCKDVLSLPTTSGVTLPHAFIYILSALGTDESAGSGIYEEIKESYKYPVRKKTIKNAFSRARTNSGTGDTYVYLDLATLPIVYDKVGKNPRWVELTVSRGVEWLGTHSRMKTMNMLPKWMAVDLYHYEELIKAEQKYYSVCDENDPWKLLNYDQSDPEDTFNRLRQVFNERNGYVGFLRADFESKRFPHQVLSSWRAKTGSHYPDLIRMTGTLGVTGRSMQNLIESVNPDGGLIILDGYNLYEANQTTVWQVRHQANGLRLELLYTSG